MLAQQIPRAGKLDIEAFNRQVHTLARAYLDSHRKEMREIDLDGATSSVSTIEAATDNIALNQAEMLPKAVRTLADETTRMVVGFLKPSAQRSSSRMRV
ncbi:hypothetical protein [Bradyrhizobium manausense]|uniref:hypothetical protein n=1 Tax=Bradyrhizobium manausense TaxID=989370 RepID=UPI001BA97D6A|nr:hypothetical protein [Bradyrhizobium manausense]MBR0720744.1 hypothetical protein [Bradyrhizobium manausense]